MSISIKLHSTDLDSSDPFSVPMRITVAPHNGEQRIERSMTLYGGPGVGTSHSRRVVKFLKRKQWFIAFAIDDTTDSGGLYWQVFHNEGRNAVCVNELLSVFIVLDILEGHGWHLSDRIEYQRRRAKRGRVLMTRRNLVGTERHSKQLDLLTESGELAPNDLPYSEAFVHIDDLEFVFGQLK